MMRHLLAALFAGAVCLQAAAAPSPPRVTTRLLQDAERDRAIPLRITAPPADAGFEPPRPAVFFSHGLGGSVEAAGYLAQGLARRGYVVVNVQHPGSDESVWRGVPRLQRLGALRRAANAEQAAERPLDLSVALTALLVDGEPAIDAGRVAVAGHSFGAHTVRFLLGERPPGGRSFADPRFRAGIHISGQAIPDPTVLAGVTVPVLHLTGTLDDSPLSPDLVPADRRDAYDAIGAPDQFLIVFDGADHAVFGGDRGFSRNPRDAEHDAAVRRGVVWASLVFLDAVLGVPPAAPDPEDLRAALGGADALEWK